MNPTLQAVLDLTDQVHAAIAAGEWQRASDLETVRRDLLEQLLGGTTPDSLPLAAAAALAQLHERSHHLVGEVEHHKRRLLREASIVKIGREAARAYGMADSGS
jgi:hypothetical protein